MATKRFMPSLLNIPEEENHYLLEPSYEFTNPGSRRGSAISLKRENSRRKTCTGCPGCEPQDFNSFSGKLPEFPSLAACQNCTTSDDSKQRSIRKWLEDVPILKAENDSSFHQDVNSNKPTNALRRVRSPTRSLPPDNFHSRDQERALSPRPASERGLHYDFYQQRHKPPKSKQLHEETIMTPCRKEENHYETLPTDKENDVTMNLPPPDMIHEAMAVDKSGEKVTTLTKKQMNAVINELTVHRNLLMHQNESDSKGPPVDYETDSLERSGYKGSYFITTSLLIKKIYFQHSSLFPLLFHLLGLVSISFCSFSERETFVRVAFLIFR